MDRVLNPVTRARLDIQGMECVSDARLLEVAPWQRLAYGGCAVMAGLGTALGSPAVLMALIPVAVLAAVFPVHPFDLIYNLAIRHVRGTGPLPRRGIPARFACGMGSVWLGVSAWAFASGHTAAGYVLGGALTSLALLVSTTDICVPSMLYRMIFGRPPVRVGAIDA